MIKKAIFALCLAGLSLSASASKVAVISGTEYTIDTLKHVKTGPGTYYTAVVYKVPNGREMRGFFLTMDLKNQKDVEYRVEVGKDSILNVETPSSVANRKSTPGQYYYAGVNADFYITSGNIPALMGTPNECCIMNGTVATNGFDNVDARGHLFFDFKGNMWCDMPTHSFYFTNGNGSKFVFDDVNILRPGSSNNLVLFNEIYGKYTKNTNRTEVVVQLADGEQWRMNKTIRAKVVSAPSTGGKTIAAGQAVLSADGSRVADIASLKPGDEISFNFDMSLKYHNVIPDIKECAGGDVVILKDGEVVMEADRWINPRDANNPRTMAGYDKDRNIMVWGLIDGRSSISSGCTYPEGAEMMRLAGCDDAVNFDGGGSSTMFIRNLGVMNKPSDGNERAVANGLYAVLKAPEDNTISEIAFADYKYTFPHHGIYTPRFYGYNKYGLLIDTDVQGVVLECDKELGEIINEGKTFYGNGSGCHKLTAVYGSVKTDIPVTILEGNNATARLQNVVNDGYHDYTVEVVITHNEEEMPINPSALTWQSDNEAVATVGAYSGVVKGVSNGTATITGKIGENTTSLNVVVEKPTTHIQAIDPGFDASTWSIKQTGGRNGIISPSGNGFVFEYDGASGRNPSIRLEKNIRLWSIPDSLRFRINPGEAPVNNVRIYLRDAQNEQFTISLNDLKSNAENVYNCAFKDIFDATDLIHFPVSLTCVHMLMGSSTAGTHYAINVPGLETVYDALGAGVERVSDAKPLIVYPNPVVSGSPLHTEWNGTDNSIAIFYNMAGAAVAAAKVELNAGNAVISTSGLEPGEYILTLSSKGIRQSTIITVK